MSGKRKPKLNSPRKPGPKGISEARLKAALRKNAGVYSRAAADLGCDRQNVRQRVERSPELVAFVESIRDEIGDLADTIIIDTLSRRDAAGRPAKEAREMARWHKDYSLRARGLALRVEHTGAGGEPLPPASINIVVSYVGPKEDVV